jgi:hypothetical protein
VSDKIVALPAAVNRIMAVDSLQVSLALDVTPNDKNVAQFLVCDKIVAEVDGLQFKK